jgi:hypothetical protein
VSTAGLEELAGLIHFRVGAWHDFGYETPPAPECATIPPLGQRSARAIEAGHEAIKDIDQLIARLHQVRALLVSELRQDEDIRMARCAVCGHPPHLETPMECADCPECYCEAIERIADGGQP